MNSRVWCFGLRALNRRFRVSRVYSVSLAEVANIFGTQGWCALWIHLGFPSISLAYLASAIPQKLRGEPRGQYRGRSRGTRHKLIFHLTLDTHYPLSSLNLRFGLAFEKVATLITTWKMTGSCSSASMSRV